MGHNSLSLSLYIYIYIFYLFIYTDRSTEVNWKQEIYQKKKKKKIGNKREEYMVWRFKAISSFCN